MCAVSAPTMATGTLLDGTCMKRDESLRSVPRREAPSHEPEPPLHERTVQQGAEPAEPGTTGPAAAARGDSAVRPGQSMMDYYLQRSLGAAQIKITRPGD